MNIKFIAIGMVLAVTIGVSLTYGEKKLDTLAVAANAVAKTGCSCVFIAGRDLDACLKDNPPGFDVARASLDRENASVEAAVFYVIRAHARYHGATGCALE